MERPPKAFRTAVRGHWRRSCAPRRTRMSRQGLLRVETAFVDVNRDHADRANLAGARDVNSVGGARDGTGRRQHALVCDGPDWLGAAALHAAYLLNQIEQASRIRPRADWCPLLFRLKIHPVIRQQTSRSVIIVVASSLKRPHPNPVSSPIRPGDAVLVRAGGLCYGTQDGIQTTRER
jgi:hypothetical protein